MGNSSISDENICKSCYGKRKVFNPETKKWEPCSNCEGDGSVSGKVGDQEMKFKLHNPK